MMIGTFAITGVGIPLTHIGFAGFLSKDAVIESAWAGSNAMAGYAFWLLVVAACFTSFYSWRLIFLTFYGKSRGDHHAHDHAHESPRTMLVPLGVLAVGSVLAGMIWYGSFFGDHAKMNAFFGIPHHAEATEPAAADAASGTALTEAPATEAPADAAATAPAAEEHAAAGAHAAGEGGAVFFGPENHTIENAHEAPAWVKVSPFVAMLIGFVVSYLFYIVNPELPRSLARSQPVLYRFLLNKWYFDEIYDFLFVRPARWIGRFLWKRGDGTVIDGTINDVTMGFVPWVTRLAGRAQSGYLFHYAFAMVVGIVVMTLWLGLRSVG
jgi:NADH-quinone oxidoreductase subunit L